MCLYSKTDKPMVATKDIYVYKVLRVAVQLGEIALLSPFLGVRWNFNRQLSVKIRPQKAWPWRGRTGRQEYRIEAGLHACTSIRKAKSLANARWISSRNFIFVAKIPKGTNYYLGSGGDIVAEEMVVLRRDDPESLQHLGISRMVPISRFPLV